MVHRPASICLSDEDLAQARQRIGQYMDALSRDGTRITEKLDFEVTRSAAVRERQELVMKSFDSEVAEKPAMNSFDSEIGETARWLASPRFEGITRLYSARQVVEQQGTIATDYTVARMAAGQFYDRLRQLFAERKSITTFGPSSPGRLSPSDVWASKAFTWAVGHVGEGQRDRKNAGAVLASYPLSQVPDEAASIVRALLTADKNQLYARSRMTAEQRAATPEIDYRPFIIADADTGHGGDAHVRNLIRRFVEIGVPGYHIEDQKPGVKKCGRRAAKCWWPRTSKSKG